ncbi:MAG: hypothetical protein FGM14_14435 [Flavobacteriales bacterium]|nr:hypothetical protein [Flavobacteriales bacterium]
MFLTLTGVVFVYLLLGKDEVPYFQNLRVKKGYKRVLELFFWGTLLQLSTFHVLQCIAVGIFIILITYGIYHTVKIIPIWIYFFVLGTTFFLLYIPVNKLPESWPEGAPEFIQNMIRAPKNRSLFPIVPSLGYTFYGAFIGSLFFHFKQQVLSYKFAAIVGGIGALLYFIPDVLLLNINKFILFDSFKKLVYIDWLYVRVGMVLMVLGLLIALNTVVGTIRQNFFLKMGQNTLTIFIIHFILLYGSLLRLGINDYFYHGLKPWHAALGAFIFVTFFAILINNIEAVKERLSFILDPIKNFWARVYGLNK